ncbi:MAG: 1-acyl-sn-glycerol-3-phosphate acyltransferase [Peptococcaceae bacterium]|nr:1-acyl-sn-glycerol-3-phosphate acyltransferase [Peptococcaceae bacterium]
MFTYRFFAVIFRCILFLCGTKINGRENVPMEGPVVLIGNHKTNADPILLGVASPRPVNFVAKAELFQNPVVGWFLKVLGGIPIHRGEQDVGAMRESLRVLKNQGALGLFPEGTRIPQQHCLGEFKNGAVMIALRGGATMVPVAIKNSHHFCSFFHRDVTVTIGKPIQLPETKSLPAEELDKISQNLRTEICQMLGLEDCLYPGKVSIAAMQQEEKG